MSLAHRVLLPGFSGTTLPDWLAAELRAGLAGVLLFAENTPDVATTRALTDAVRAIRSDAITACDEEGGDVTRLQAATGSAIPGNAALGLIDDTGLTSAIACSYGRLIALAGIDLALAPCLDVASEPTNPIIGVRSFGAEADLVARHGSAFVAGLAAGGVASAAKHFPGHGDTTVDSHLDLPVLDIALPLLRRRELAPFGLVQADAVLTAHLVVPALGSDPASLSRWASDEIRAQGHLGPIITDALGMRAITDRWGIGEACVRALAAGADLLLLDAPHQRDPQADLAEALRAIEEALATGRLRATDLEASWARTATLARPARPAADAAAIAAAEQELAELGADAANRALIVHGDIRLGDRSPVLVDLRRRLNHASGAIANPLLPALRAVRPDTGQRQLAELDGLGAGEQVVALTRQPLADASEAADLARLLQAHPDAIVVHGGVSAAAPACDRLVLMHGVSRASAQAAAQALTKERP